MPKRYYIFYLEIALRKDDDTRIYAFENVSHIPTDKLVAIFGINLKKDPFILEGYFLTKSNYRKHRKFINAEIGPINLDIFEYSLRLYTIEGKKELRKLYKESLME